MRRSLAKKILTTGLILLTVLFPVALAGCGKGGNNSNSVSTSDNSNAGKSDSNTDSGDKEAAATEAAGTEEVTKPDKITIMVDGTLLDKASGQDAFAARFKEITGVELVIIQPDHNTYSDQVALAFTSDSVPDALILSNQLYTAYATQGALWDMSEAWNNSAAKASGQMKEANIEALKIDGSLYGFAPASGNGCITYVRQDWLDNLGLPVPTTYDQYIEMLRAFTEDDPDGNGKKDTYGVTAAGIIGPEIPYTNYLPEFWQNAYPDFYQKADGTWADGFRETANADALGRLKDAYSKGYIDMEVATNTTSACRDKFYAGNTGVFTYWAGKWNMTLEQNVQSTYPDAKLTALPPIAELGNYIERQPPVWAITSASKNPEGVFKYLIESMVDGGDGQMLWTYGVEGVHYEKDASGTYKQLPDPEVPDNTFLSAHIDPVLTTRQWEDPLYSIRDERVKTSAELFQANSKIAPLIVPTETMSAYMATLLDARSIIVSKVVTGDMSVEDGIAQYEKEQGALSDSIVPELNSK